MAFAASGPGTIGAILPFSPCTGLETGYVEAVNEVDGRVIAVGIFVGVVLGFIVYMVTNNVIFIYLGAALGVVLALGIKKRSGGD